MAPRFLLLRHRRLAVWLVVVAGLAVSVLTWRFTARQEEERNRIGFQTRVQTLFSVASQSLRGYEEMVYSLRDAFLASDDITREEFTELARNILARHEGVQALEWVAIVPHAERAAFERNASASLGRPVHIMQRQADGSLVVAPPAPEYFAIAYVEPLAGNESALGYDLASAPSVSQITAARLDRGFKVSPPFRLIQSTQPGEQGVTFILPFWRQHEPVQGFLQGVFKLQPLLAQPHRLETNEAIDTYYLAIDPAGGPPSLLYVNFAGAEPLRSPHARVPIPSLDDPANLTTRLRVGDREWLVIARMNEAWAASVTSRQPLLILGAGLIITLLLAYTLRNLLERTSRIEAEVTQRTAELAESERRLASILSDMPGAAYRCSPRAPYTVEFVSEGIRPLCGFTATDLISGRVRWMERVPTQELAECERRIAEAIERHGTYELEYRVRHADGTERHLWERGHAVYDDAGNPVALEGLKVDATARKEAEARSREFDRQMVETQKLESLGVLAGGIAHDFNNLLTAVLGNASIARQALPASDPLQSQLQQIERAARRAADLCAQMLAYAGKSRLTTTRLDLSELVRDTTSLLEVTLNKSTRLHLDLGADLPYVQVDATQIRQIVMNLVINAADAVGDQGGEVALRTFTTEARHEELLAAVERPNLPTGRYVGLEVRDNGVGMPAEMLARIFDPFFTTKFSGRGLGLSAVLGIVRSHRGALFVESQLGVGSTFRLLLPAAPATTMNVPSSRLISASDSPASLPRLRGTILVVDDEAHVREVASHVLQMSGLAVMEAPDGEKALQLCRERAESIDLILLDLTMPGLSGDETLRRLRMQGGNQKVILISGYSAADTARRCAQLGAVAFLQKPFEIGALLGELQKHLGKN
jgi:two-component system cell cycle sensor histidine kinase/response regulator CckA